VSPAAFDPRVHAPPVVYGAFWDFPGRRPQVCVSEKRRESVCERERDERIKERERERERESVCVRLHVPSVGDGACWDFPGRCPQVCVSGRRRECVCERETDDRQTKRARERERECVCMCVHAPPVVYGAFGISLVDIRSSVCWRQTERLCVCVCERERQR